ncbi:zeta toxin family protein [Dactylosporangium sp. CA-233914]|uniref:zeta toxin family protein n=1 Tax=Dactylosporangium sp. CA-233914 TaxID=3239934 RepID=UPI003D920111
MTQPIDPRRYLLSDEQSQRIFNTRIVPNELARGVPQDDPIVVFVAGQPGAGKTRTTQAVQDRLDERGGAVVVNSDFYKPYHPQYGRLLAEDDRNAAPYTSMDGRRWMAAAERHLIEHRVDTIIETTMRDPGDFVEPAQMFRDAGYRVEAVIMAVPEPLSRLGIVDRYHTQVAEQGHGRLTARENHDASYRGVLEAARAIDEDRIVDAVDVYRRGGDRLYGNDLTPDGEWREAPAAAAAIESERARPWTPAETQRFAGDVERVAAGAGPQWRPELAGITSLAEPLASPDVPLPDLRDAASEQPSAPEVDAATLDGIRRAAASLHHARQEADRQAPASEPEEPRPDRDVDR